MSKVQDSTLKNVGELPFDFFYNGHIVGVSLIIVGLNWAGLNLKIVIRTKTFSQTWNSAAFSFHL